MHADTWRTLPPFQKRDNHHRPRADILLHPSVSGITGVHDDMTRYYDQCNQHTLNHTQLALVMFSQHWVAVVRHKANDGSLCDPSVIKLRYCTVYSGISSYCVLAYHLEHLSLSSFYEQSLTEVQTLLFRFVVKFLPNHLCIMSTCCGFRFLCGLLLHNLLRVCRRLSILFFRFLY